MQYRYLIVCLLWTNKGKVTLLKLYISCLNSSESYFHSFAGSEPTSMGPHRSCAAPVLFSLLWFGSVFAWFILVWFGWFWFSQFVLIGFG